MRLLKDIVTLLSDKDGSLTDALLKTKVLMHRIGHKELAGWVNDELNGYPSDSLVPDYRTIPTRLHGNVSNLAWRHSGTQLPTSHLPKEVRERFCVEKLRQSIQVLEQLSKSDGSLSRPITPEWYHTLAKGAIESSFHIDSAWVQFEPTQIVNVLIEVRSRLLDFALNLQDELGDVAEDDMKEAAKGIDAPGMLASAVFGDNATFVFGNNNQTTITNTVTKGDFAALAKAFKDTGVSETDVDELKAAVDDDDPKAVAETKQFGPKVKAWMGKMSEKAIGGAWSIGIAAGGKLLADERSVPVPSYLARLPDSWRLLVAAPRCIESGEPPVFLQVKLLRDDRSGVLIGGDRCRIQRYKASATPMFTFAAEGSSKSG